jgi:hypothetical protein
MNFVWQAMMSTSLPRLSASEPETAFLSTPSISLIATRPTDPPGHAIGPILQVASIMAQIELPGFVVVESQNCACRHHASESPIQAGR